VLQSGCRERLIEDENVRTEALTQSVQVTSWVAKAGRRMDRVPTQVLTPLVALCRALADWGAEELRERRERPRPDTQVAVPEEVPRQATSAETRQAVVRPSGLAYPCCVVAGCRQDGYYLGRCRDHRPTPGRNVCATCFRQASRGHYRLCNGNSWVQATQAAHDEAEQVHSQDRRARPTTTEDTSLRAQEEREALGGLDDATGRISRLVIEERR